ASARNEPAQAWERRPRSSLLVISLTNARFSRRRPGSSEYCEHRSALPITRYAAPAAVDESQSEGPAALVAIVQNGSVTSSAVSIPATAIGRRRIRKAL